VPDPRLVERVAEDLGTSPGLIEKDWQVVRALGILAALDHAGAAPAFSGGTSLLKGWQLIKRFSEDVDFKVAMPPTANPSRARTQRSRYRERIVAALTAGGFELAGKPEVSNKSQFFSINLIYRSEFPAGQGLRPHLQLEMTLQAPVLPPIARPIRSLVAQAGNEPAEVAAIPCVDPIETAADKLSALAWRVHTRDRATADDDPTIIRHLHDLAALERHAAQAPQFKELVRQAVAADVGRGGDAVPTDPHKLFAGMFEQLRSDGLWAAEYEALVRQVSFAKATEEISFTGAFIACERIVASVYD
jgi:predicted nucleotidyltransferase component of viral defense system